MDLRFEISLAATYFNTPYIFISLVTAHFAYAALKPDALKL